MMYLSILLVIGAIAVVTWRLRDRMAMRRRAIRRDRSHIFITVPERDD